MLCAEARVSSVKLRTGFLSTSDWPNLTAAAGRISEAPIFIDDSPQSATLDIRARARRLKAEHNLGLVIVDYLQLMHGSGRIESRQLEISEISRGLKGLAKELDVPIIALSQLSRAVGWKAGRTNGPSCLICGNRDPSSRMPTWSLSFTGMRCMNPNPKKPASRKF